MKVKRYFVEGLAHASYLFGQDGEAAVVDPKRDVDDYIADAEEMGLKIVAILNTHPHADFASGFPELAQRTGAKIYTSHLAPVTYDNERARDGEMIRVGGLEVKMLETPGHSPDSLSFLVSRDGLPEMVFTGDLLFVNDVGRPDLRDADADPTDLADKLYDSLFGKILSLPDKVKIYPSHGAGSLCGRAISSAPYSLVQDEKENNWAAQITDRAEFVRQMVANLPDRPAYFSYDVGVNVKGATPYSELAEVSRVDEKALEMVKSNDAVILDIRTPGAFGSGHATGSLNIGVGSPMFSTWVGFLVSGDAQIVLVADDDESVAKARLELARIGFDHVLGYILAEELTAAQTLPQLNACDLRLGLKEGSAPDLLDVRTPGEWNATHIETAQHVPLPRLESELDRLSEKKPLAVMCGSGYRSSIAASVLQSRGFENVQNVTGGMGAFMETEADCPHMLPADLVYRN